MPPAPHLFRGTLPRAPGAGAHAKAPGALVVACAVGPRGGSGAFLVDYTICFFLLRFVLVRGVGEVLLLGVVFSLVRNISLAFGFLNETLRRVGLVYGSAKHWHSGG